MKQQISLREANQHLSRYIDAVEQGDEIIITRRGKPVAKLVSFVEEKILSAEQEKAWQRLKASARPLQIGQWRRDDCYDLDE